MLTTNRAADSIRGRQRASRPPRGLAGLGVLFLLGGALVALGLAPVGMPDSYSWIEHGTSESAAQGVDGAWVARMGFILFGLAVLWLVRLRAAYWGPLATLCHLAFGVSMLGVAAFSTRPWEEDAIYVESEDLLHTVFATSMGFGFIGGVIAVMIVRRHPNLRGATSDLVALGVAMIITFTASSGVWGLLQRVMFLTAAAWYGRESWLSRLGEAAGRPARPEAHPEVLTVAGVVDDLATNPRPYPGTRTAKE